MVPQPRLSETCDRVGRRFSSVAGIDASLERTSLGRLFPSAMNLTSTRSLAGCVLIAVGLAAPASAHGDIHARIAKLTKSIRKAPGSVALYLERGELHRLHKDWAAARRDFQTVRRLAPRLVELDLHEGRLELSAGCYDRARQVLDRFLAGHPRHVRGLQCRARLLTIVEAKAAALRDYDTLIGLAESPNPDHYLERARAQQGFGIDSAEVVRGLDEGVRKLGPLVVLHQRALQIELTRRAWPQALRRLDRMLAAMPLRAPWLLRRGMVLERMGKPAEARRAYSEGLAELDALPRRNKIQGDLQHSLRSRLRRLAR